MTEQEEYDLALTERVIDIRRRNQREDRRQWIEEADNRGGVLQVACTYANIGFNWGIYYHQRAGVPGGVRLY